MLPSKAVFERSLVSSAWVVTTTATSGGGSFLLDSLIQVLERDNQMGTGLEDRQGCRRSSAWSSFSAWYFCMAAASRANMNSGPGAKY